MKTLPFLSVPSAAMYSSGIRPARTATGSPLPTPRLLQNVGEAVRFVAEVGIGKVAPRAILGEPSQRHPVPSRTSRVTVDGLVGDVESTTTWKAVELSSRLAPGKFRTCPLIIEQIGHDRPVLRLGNRWPARAGSRCQFRHGQVREIVPGIRQFRHVTFAARAVPRLGRGSYCVIVASTLLANATRASA